MSRFGWTFRRCNLKHTPGVDFNVNCVLMELVFDFWGGRSWVVDDIVADSTLPLNCQPSNWNSSLPTAIANHFLRPDLLLPSEFFPCLAMAEMRSTSATTGTACSLACGPGDLSRDASFVTDSYVVYSSLVHVLSCCAKILFHPSYSHTLNLA